MKHSCESVTFDPGPRCKSGKFPIQGNENWEKKIKTRNAYIGIKRVSSGVGSNPILERSGVGLINSFLKGLELESLNMMPFCILPFAVTLFQFHDAR